MAQKILPASHNEPRHSWVTWGNYDQFLACYPGYRPFLPAVYVLFRGGRVVYVGQSEDVKRRIQTHRLRFQFDAIKTRRVSDRADRMWLERKLLYRLRPRHNGTLPPELRGDPRYCYQFTPGERRELARRGR